MKNQKMQSRTDTARLIVLICHRLYEHGFVTATDGNVSARLADGHILTTPTSLNKGKIAESDLVEVNTDGTPITLGRQASTELGMHLTIYRQRPDVRAIVHAHPTYATGFAAARVPLTECIFPEVIVGLGAIPLAPYATPSTDEVTEAIVPFVRSADAILLSNHGVVTYGPDLEDAYFKMEKVEHAAHILFVARMLGGEHVLTKAQVERLRAITATAYGKDPSKLADCDPAPAGEEDVKKMIREVIAERLKTKN